MLSLALRYGTTRHIAPGEQQIEGDRKNGVGPLVWRGDDVAKTRALIHTFITTFQNKAPEFKDVRYDFNRRGFVGRLGQPIHREEIQRGASEGMGRSARAGEATMRRGVLIQSLVSSEGRERPGILEQVLNRARTLVLGGNLDQSFSRQPQKATFQGGFFVSGLPRSQISAVVEAITRAWKNAPEIVIVDDMNDPAIPEAVRLENQRQLSQGATGQPEGFFAGGRVYIVASQIERPGDVARVLLHESLGHYGLRGLYGEGLNKILKQIAALRRGDVEAMAKRYGLDMENEADRLQAAEEVLAHLAQTRPESGFVQRAIAVIRKWLRENIPGFEELKLSDGEIIEHFLLPARRFVEQGGTAAQGGMVGAFSRGSKEGIIRENNRRLTALRDTLKPVPNIAAALEAVRGNEEKKIKGFLRKPLTNLETGMEATVTGVSLNKMKDKSAWEKSDSVMAHYHALANLDILFELATHTVPGREGRKPNDASSLKALHKFATPMPYRDKVLNVVMTVREFAEPGKYGNQLYTFEALEIVTPASFEAVRGVSTVPVSQARHLHPPAGVTPRLMEMIAIVKGEVKPDDVRFSRSVAAQFANAANRAANVAPVASVAPAVPSPGGGLTPWRDRMDRIADSLIYNFQDRFKPLRDIQKRMVPAREEEDAVLVEERYSGIVRARTDDFHADLRDPLIEAIHDGKLAWEEVEEYLHARHAPSRNAAMREINPTEEEIADRRQDWKASATCSPRMPTCAST